MIQDEKNFSAEANIEWLEVCKRLRIYRNSLGLNQAKFAAKIGKAQSYYSIIEQGKARPSAEILLAIAKLGCDMNWLLMGTIDEAKVESYLSHGFTMLSLIDQIEHLDDKGREFIYKVIKAYTEASKNVSEEKKVGDK